MCGGDAENQARETDAEATISENKCLKRTKDSPKKGLFLVESQRLAHFGMEGSTVNRVPYRDVTDERISRNAVHFTAGESLFALRQTPHSKSLSTRT